MDFLGVESSLVVNMKRAGGCALHVYTRRVCSVWWIREPLGAAAGLCARVDLSHAPRFSSSLALQRLHITFIYSPTPTPYSHISPSNSRAVHICLPTSTIIRSMILILLKKNVIFVGVYRISVFRSSTQFSGSPDVSGSGN